MIGALGAHASTFLLVVAVGTVALFGGPMVIAPMRWARVLGWTIPTHTDLAVYFGRCLGAVIVVLGGAALWASAHVAQQPFFFAMLAGCAAAMVLVHVWGALRRIQPPAETWEIGYWLALLALTLAFWPAAPS
jgi:hypothetical protein